MTGTDKISFTCPHCGALIKETSGKIRGDAIIPCPACKMDITFSQNSPNEAIRKALSAARKARLAANK